MANVEKKGDTISSFSSGGEGYEKSHVVGFRVSGF